MSEDSFFESLDADSVDDPEWTGESSPTISRSQTSLRRDNTRQQRCMDRAAEKQAQDDIFIEYKQALLQRATVASATVTLTANSAIVLQLQPCPPNITKNRGQTSLVWHHCKEVSHNDIFL